MSQRTKRRRVSSEQETVDGLAQDPKASVDTICNPATAAEKESWNGFCEIESEPVSCHTQLCSMKPANISKALFNVMLREFGVNGVKVQEVVSLDDEMLAFLR